MSGMPRIPAPTSARNMRPPEPFRAPVTGDIEQRLSEIADAINQKADRTAPTFAWVRLVSPNGTSWAITVDDIGNLHTTQVLR